MVDVDQYYSELYEKVSLQLAPLCDSEKLALADSSYDQMASTRTEGGEEALVAQLIVGI